MSKFFKRSLLAVSVASGLVMASTAHATHGMNMDSYGAIAGGMGGAAMASNVGNSAVMNNPATLGMNKDGNVIGLGYTLMAPRVWAETPQGMRSDSKGRWYHMPSASYIRTQGQFSFGAAVMAQGGMGTDYGSGSAAFAGGCAASTMTMGQCVPTMMSGQDIRSELSVGRMMFPLAYKVNDKVSLAAQLDVVWAGLDMRMDIDGNTFGMMAFPDGGTPGVGSASGSMVDGFKMMMGQGAIEDVNYARFDFSNDSRFTGDASSAGLGGKLGIVVQPTDRVTLGATYHMKTNLGDMKTGGANVSFAGTGAFFDQMLPPEAGGVATLTGDIRIRDFQWPETFAVGIAVQATDRLRLAADIKRLNWSKVMDTFDMSFTAANTPANGSFAGAQMDASLDQDWDDQTVFAIGGAYQLNDQWIVRAGANFSSNPIPDGTVNPLFPAITEQHYSAGFTYRINPRSALHGAITYAPRVTVTNTGPSLNGMKMSHAQTLHRVNYGYRF
ncbi:MAG: OmpP1/FadL family transporter [Halothiobacillaceae bacterium]